MRKSLIAIAFITSCATLSAAAGAETGHVAHPRHNMVVHGTAEVFASHLVYKVPHNFQVILRVRFPEAVQAVYAAARTAHPEDTYIYLLDPVHVADLAAQERVSGVLFRMDADGARVDLAAGLVLERSQFDVVYSEELPLSLAADPARY